MRVRSFINKKEVREYLLQQAEQTRAHKFTRVSKETLDEINERVRQVLVNKVASLPSKGKTI